MAIAGDLVRCPKCIRVLPGGGAILDPEQNRCPNCGHIFSAAQALFEHYPKRGRKRLAGSGVKGSELFGPDK